MKDKGKERKKYGKAKEKLVKPLEGERTKVKIYVFNDKCGKMFFQGKANSDLICFRQFDILTDEL